MPLLDNDFLKKLEQLDIVSRKLFAGRTKGERRSKKRGTSVEFADYRDYSPGDEPRFIDWNIYGRLDRLFLKLFVEEEDLHLYLLVDCSRSMDFGDPSKFDYARKVCAALGYIGLVGLNRVAISAFSSETGRYFPLSRGKAQMWKMLDFLEETPCDGETSLAAASKEFVLRHRQQGVAIIISDFCDKDGYDEALRFFLSRRYELFVLHVLSEEEVNPDVKGDVRLVDTEDGEMTEITVNDALLKTYRNNFNAFCGGLKTFCTRHGINYLSATTTVPFDDLVLRYMRRAGLLA